MSCRTHRELQVLSHNPLHWAKAYLAGERSGGAVTADRNGIINEQLAFYAVRSALTQDVKDVEKLAEAVKKGALTAERGSDEFLYGRVGCLYLLRLAIHWVAESGKNVKPVIEDIIEKILSHGAPWPWHGKDYLGAVHGRIGIITQVILCDPSKASNHDTVLKSLVDCLQLQLKDGNWPSSIDSGHHHLVQFCHGAPGFVISLKAIQNYVPSELKDKIGIACKLGESVTFEKGLLTKEPNICHGSTGNALALPSPYREHFMAFTSRKTIENGIQQGWYHEGDDPYGLFCGEAGRAWGWAMLDSQADNISVIGYNDV
ncbi:MAG: hypothetical protein Q9191_002164 [Dirinaria sp. TL-2023a]